MNTPSRVPFCSCSTCSVGGTPTGVAPSARDEIADRGRREADAQARMSSTAADGLLGRVHVAGLVGEEQQDLHALVLGVEVLGAQLGVVEHLGADLGAADQIRELDQLGQRKAPGRRAVRETRPRRPDRCGRSRSAAAPGRSATPGTASPRSGRPTPSRAARTSGPATATSRAARPRSRRASIRSSAGPTPSARTETPAQGPRSPRSRPCGLLHAIGGARRFACVAWSMPPAGASTSVPGASPRGRRSRSSGP